MRKFRNKKLASALVLFLLVFIMAGAFAAFQAILDVRGRVNMYAPSVDAIIANLHPIAAPLGMMSEIDDPYGYHNMISDGLGGLVPAGRQPEVGGRWLGMGTGAGIRTPRYNQRQFLPVPWSTSTPAILPGTQLFLDDEQTIGANLANTPELATDWANTWLATLGPDRRLESRHAAWWAWGHGGSTGNTAVAGVPFGRPGDTQVRTAVITEPTDFQTLYLNLSFDNFDQFYYFNLELANVGVVPLEVENVRIERVPNAAVGVAATGPWDIDGTLPTNPALNALTLMLRDNIAQGIMHPEWINLIEGATVTFPDTTTYDIAQADGRLGLLDVLVDLDPAELAPGQTNRYGEAPAANDRVLLPVTDLTAGSNTAAIGLHFGVVLENWNVFIDNFTVWGPGVIDGFNANYTAPHAAIVTAPELVSGTPNTWAVWAADTDIALALADSTSPEYEALAKAVQDSTFNHALSGTFRISYTVVPLAPTGTRPAGGVQP